jgi:hypothetical protein
MKADHFDIITFHPLVIFEKNSFINFHPKVFNFFLMRPAPIKIGATGYPL